MSGIEFSEANWPIITLRMKTRLSDEEFDEQFAFFERTLGGGNRTAIVYFVDQFSPNPAHVKRMAEWTRSHMGQLEGSVVCLAFIIKSRAFKLMLSSLQLVVSLPYPVEVFTDPQEAQDWVESMCEQAGIKFTAFL
ncbi:MAG: hypothetical protein MJE66_18830 [Proteobacteria bacterium]|nr:hypothetical protein [Pseudomonadota bacterium]